MKKIFTILGISAAMFASAQNLVQNPGFETGALAPWVKGWNSSYTEPTISNSGAHSGTYHATYAPSATTGFYQDIIISPSTEYTLSFWYKATGSPSTGNTARIWCDFKVDASSTSGIYLTDDAATDPLRNYNEYLPETSEWTQKTVTFTSLSGVTIFQYALRAYNGSNVAFDDFSLVEGTLATVDFSKDKLSLVKNTVVSDKIIFAKDASVTIYNTAGQVVKSAKVSDGTALDVSSLSAGVYVVAGSVNGQNVSQKIIKK